MGGIEANVIAVQVNILFKILCGVVGITSAIRVLQVKRRTREMSWGLDPAKIASRGSTGSTSALALFVTIVQLVM